MSDDKYKRGMERLLENLDLERATQLAEVAGVKDTFLVKVEESRGDPYRGTPDYKGSLLEALTTREGNALEQSVETALVQREVSLTDKIGAYVTSAAVKIGSGMYSLVKGVVMPLCPMEVQEWWDASYLQEKSLFKKLWNIVVRHVADYIPISLSLQMLVPAFKEYSLFFSLGLGLVNGILRQTKRFENYGPWLVEAAFYPLHLTGKKLAEVHNDAQKRIEEKRRLLSNASDEQ